MEIVNRRCCRIINLFALISILSFAPIHSASASDSEPTRTNIIQQSSSQANEISITPDVARSAGTDRNSSIICSGKWQGPNAGWLTNWYTGNERYAVFQDPLATGCAGAYPFTVTDIIWRVTNQTAASLTVQVRPTVYAAAGTVACPFPGNVIESGPTYGVILPPFVTALVTLPLDTPVCVTGAYFAGVECPQFIGLGKLGINVDSSQVVPKRNCASYNDFRGGWEDLIVANNFPGNLFIWSLGLDAASGNCTIVGPCCSGITGNVDCDLNESVDIADLTVLVDHLFISFGNLCCPDEGNVDTAPGVDIADLTLLVDHLFISFTPLPSCP